jgi:hypothetical protein
MNDNWKQYTAEYMANEYKRDASEWKYKFDKMCEAVDELIEVMPKEQIVWYPDVDEKVQMLVKLLNKRKER